MTGTRDYLQLLLAREGKPRLGVVFAAHNMAFQGLFDPAIRSTKGLAGDRSAPIDSDLEFFGHVSYLKAGIRCADRVATVSPSYAREVLEPVFGYGLEGVLRSRDSDFSGILNGIEDDCWDPAADPWLASLYNGKDRSG